MYVILTSKAGQYTTEAADGMTPMEAYDYLFCGRKKAHYVIAELSGDVKVTVTEAGAGGTVNHVPTRFLPKFDTLADARAELQRLTSFGRLDTALVRV